MGLILYPCTKTHRNNRLEFLDSATLPQLQPRASGVDLYFSNEVWLSPPLGEDYILSRNPELAATKFCIHYSLREKFRPNAGLFREYRRGKEKEFNSIHGFTKVGHPVQNAFREGMQKNMAEQLRDRPDMLTAIRAEFPPGCRRVTPDNGFLTAIQQLNLRTIESEILHFTSQGLQSAVSSQPESFDVIIYATGYDTSFGPTFPILSVGGVDLRDNSPPRQRLICPSQWTGFLT
jgi:cation diffusion facilitator CzcD-associated flavoprotein CzcO